MISYLSWAHSLYTLTSAYHDLSPGSVLLPFKKNNNKKKNHTKVQALTSAGTPCQNSLKSFGTNTRINATRPIPPEVLLV